MQLCDIFLRLGEDNFQQLVRSISLGKLKTYQMFDSIKTRLHLTPDQEQMWPAVEAALRNIAYTRSREAQRHGAPANTQVASADGVDVRDLKSAAIPLIMSFNSEQKDEVRNLAHVMGLDQLATQF